MRVTTPTGREYDVRRRWLPWRRRVPVDAELLVTLVSALELVVQVVLLPFVLVLRAVRLLPWTVVVRDTGARRAAAVVATEDVRGWRASQKRVEQLAGERREQHVDPETTGFPVVLTRDSVAMGDDAVDNTTVLQLDDRTTEPTLATLLTAVQERGRFVSIAGAPTTWVLRTSTSTRTYGRPLAVLVLDGDRESIDLYPVGDTSFRVAREGRFHLEYLLTQSVERTLELVSRDPGGKRGLREDRVKPA